jgi:homoserine dehydrogenase
LSDSLNIGIAGLGTVGVGVVKLLTEQQALLRDKCGRPLNIAAVSARSRNKDRGVDLGAYRWHDDPLALADDPGVDLVVELIGGEDGVAKALVERALAAGKDVVTANKALLAHHGTALAEIAEGNDVSLNYEAAVAGGIPIVKALREGLAGNPISRVYGILNGTCNYILTTMRETGRDFGDVLAEAQRLGYAEADPAFDIDGVDAAHKLAILTSLAFGCPVDFGHVHVEGVRDVSALDIEYAEELGYRIKLLAMASHTEHGIEQRVHPCMVDADTPIAHVDGVFNAVVAEGAYVGQTVFEGQGAGAGPTASAVVADLIDVACGRRAAPFGVSVTRFKRPDPAAMAAHQGAYYLRFMVQDRPGVLAELAGVLRDEEVSIESLLQRSRSADDPVPVVMITHETREDCMIRAVRAIGGLDAVLGQPTLIRIEHL